MTSLTDSNKGWASGSLWDMTGCARITTFIGAGGKTTCLQSLTQEINSYGLRIVATTTTKVFPDKQMNVWRSPYPPPYNQEGACFWYVKAMDEQKWIGPPLEVVDDAILEDLRLDDKRFWVIEGDGARRCKLKCWGQHEPQIPRHSDCAVLVLDGGLWGSVLQADQIHRLERCSDILGHVWQAKSAWTYFLKSPVFASKYEKMSWVILLNCYGVNVGKKDVLDPIRLLHELNHRWAEIQGKAENPETRPKHLRLAAGDAKEGKLQWFDLW